MISSASLTSNRNTRLGDLEADGDEQIDEVAVAGHHQGFFGDARALAMALVQVRAPVTLFFRAIRESRC